MFNLKARQALVAAKAAKAAPKASSVTPEQQAALDKARDERASELVAAIMAAASVNVVAATDASVKALVGITLDVPIMPNAAELAHLATRTRGADGTAFLPYEYQGTGKFANITARAVEMLNAAAKGAGVDAITWRDTRGAGTAASGAADIQYGTLAWAKAGITPAVVTMPDGSTVPTSGVLKAGLSMAGNIKLGKLARADAGYGALVKALLAASKRVAEAKGDADALGDALQEVLDNAPSIIAKARETASVKAKA